LCYNESKLQSKENRSGENEGDIPRRSDT
jgi:hypothetical protein